MRNHRITELLNHRIPYSVILLFSYSVIASAAVPLSWTVETSRAQPATFEAYQGETLTFEASLQSHGKPLEAPSNYSFFWQTNGMGSTYWEAPCQGVGVGDRCTKESDNSTVDLHLQPTPTNVLFATWLPSMDVGAKVYNCFIGSPSNIYHAAFQLRLRPSPGALPNALPLPVPVIDFATIRVLNPPWSGGGGGGVDTNAVRDIAAEVVTGSITNDLTLSGKAADAKATKEYVDAKDAATLQAAKDYTDQHGGGGGAVQSVNGKTGEVVLDAAAIPYGGVESYGSVTNVENGLDYAISTANYAMTEATGRPTYEDLDGYLPLSGGTVNGPLMLPYDEIETMSISMAGPGGEFALTGGASYHIWQYWPNPDAEGDREIAVKGDIPDVAPLASDARNAYLYSRAINLYMTANTNAWFAGTNYVFGADAATRQHFAWEPGMDAATVPCSMALWENRDGVKQCVWDQRDWTAWYWSFKAGQMRSEIAATNKAIYAAITSDENHAWAKRYASSGRVNPDPTTTFIDTQSVCLSPGMNWETVATVGGCGYWTIVGDGAVIGGSDTNAVLEIKDFEGNSIMRIAKGEHRLAWLSSADFVGQMTDADGWVCFDMRADVQPVGYFSATLEAADFVAETDANCPAMYRWENRGGGVWRVHFLLKSGIVSSSCFAKFIVEVQGKTQIRYEADVVVGGALIFNGVKIAPVIPAGAAVGSTVTWKVVQ